MRQRSIPNLVCPLVVATLWPASVWERKASAGGSIHVSVRRTAKGGVVLTVKDTGIGMAAADIPKAMQPFGQLGDVHTRNRPGTGLGLPIVRSLVELHEGKFHLASEIGVGTSAEISFPARRVVAN